MSDAIHETWVSTWKAPSSWSTHGATRSRVDARAARCDEAALSCAIESSTRHGAQPREPRIGIGNREGTVEFGHRDPEMLRLERALVEPRGGERFPARCARDQYVDPAHPALAMDRRCGARARGDRREIRVRELGLGGEQCVHGLRETRTLLDLDGGCDARLHCSHYTGARRSAAGYFSRGIGAPHLEPTSAAGVFGSLAALAAVLGAWIGPGFALAVTLDAGRDPLERFALSLAFGRLLLAAVSIAACTASAPALLVVWGLLGAAAGAFAGWRSHGRATRTGTERAVAVAIARAVLLVVAVVGRSALPDGDGALAFLGRDCANDPFVYGAFALALRDAWPAARQSVRRRRSGAGFVRALRRARRPRVGSGAAIPDLVYRVLPLTETLALAVTAIAFVRALGAPRLAWLLAPALLLLGGDPSPWLAPLGRVLGFAVQRLDSWSLFGPYLLSINPIAAGMQTLLCAYLLWRSRRGTRRRDAIAAGLLVGALVEIKLFLWAPAIAGCSASRCCGRLPVRGGSLRWSAGAAALASLPSLVEKLAWVGRRAFATKRASGSVSAAYRATSWTRRGERRSSPSRSSARVRPRSRRAFCWHVPSSWRSPSARARSRSENCCVERAAATAIVYRQLAVGSLLGFTFAFAIGTPPHFLNAAQFAWIATFGLWPLLAIAMARWTATAAGCRSRSLRC